jgi:hypothetical protein
MKQTKDTGSNTADRKAVNLTMPITLFSAIAEVARSNRRKVGPQIVYDLFRKYGKAVAE